MYIFLLKLEQLAVIFFHEVYQLDGEIVVLNELGLLRFVSLVGHLNELQLRCQVLLGLHQLLLVSRKSIGHTRREVLHLITLTTFEQLVGNVHIQVVYQGCFRLILHKCLIRHIFVYLQIVVQCHELGLCSFKLRL